MTLEFYREYLKKDNAARRQLLYIMNPNKFQACQFLMQFHEARSEATVMTSTTQSLPLWGSKLCDCCAMSSPEERSSVGSAPAGISEGQKSS